MRPVCGWGVGGGERRKGGRDARGGSANDRKLYYKHLLYALNRLRKVAH
jgi:hypothetical protein